MAACSEGGSSGDDVGTGKVEIVEMEVGNGVKED
jgi:hypothetical protein